VEKIDYLVFDEFDPSSLSGIAAHAIHVYVAADLPKAPLLMGKGANLRGVVCVWVDTIDDRGPMEELLRGADGYLVTESVPQPPAAAALTHFTWFPKPDRLTEAEFFHGWHEVHTPSTFALHPHRCGYVRDSVARVLTPGSPRVDAIVFEHFPTVEDYTDPRRLFGSKEALDETSKHLALFADFDSINSCPLFLQLAE
jgi:hypothetical protein